MQGYELYLFDVDDTLIRTFDTVSNTHYRELAYRLGVPFPSLDTIRSTWGGNLEVSLKAIFGERIDISHAQNILEELHSKMSIPPAGGAIHILDTLKKHGKFVGLFSSSIPSILDLGIRNSLKRKPDDFDFVFSTIEQDLEKPSAHIVFIAMEKYRQKFGRELNCEDVLVIGDSLVDYKTACNAGVDFAAILSGITTRQLFLGAGLKSDAIFDTIQHAVTAPEEHGVVAIIRDESGRYLLIEEARSGHQYEGHWSGPHGSCEPYDVIEEETVVREVWEEVGIYVRPRKKLYTRVADTKVKTVSFWETEQINSRTIQINATSREVRRVGWFDKKDILSGGIPLYPGTYDFFTHSHENGGY